MSFKMEVDEVKKMLFGEIEVTVTKLDYAYLIVFPSGKKLTTDDTKDIKKLKEIKP